jgi:hypothetical protein
MCELDRVDSFLPFFLSARFTPNVAQNARQLCGGLASGTPAVAFAKEGRRLTCFEKPPLLDRLESIAVFCFE